MAFDTGEILTSAQAQETILDKLPAGHTSESDWIHALRPDPARGVVSRKLCKRHL